jgi:hypothetical protein
VCLFHESTPINIRRESVRVEVSGYAGHGHTQHPFFPEENLWPEIQPRLKNDLAKTKILKQVAGKEERIEDAILGQGQPQAAI